MLRKRGAARFGEALYDAEQREALPDTATLASLGCGNPTAVADLREGEVVLDLGSGGGIDVILSAKRVGPTGIAWGLDMTEEMLALARANAAEAGVANAHFLKGQIEAVPLPADSVDVVVSNCVINLSTDKPAVFGGARASAQAGRPDRNHRHRRRGPPFARRPRRARLVLRLHRRRALEGRVRAAAGGRGLQGRVGRVHARGRRRHARRDREGDEARIDPAQEKRLPLVGARTGCC